MSWSGLVWNVFEMCFCWKLILHGLSHGQPKPCLKPCLCSESSEWKFCWTVALHGLLHRLPRPCPKPCGNLENWCVTRWITRVTQTVYHPVSWLWTVWMDYTGRHTVCTNRVQDRVLHKSLKIDLVWYKFWNGRNFIKNIDIIRWIWILWIILDLYGGY